jgi:hypothetical protein
VLAVPVVPSVTLGYLSLWPQGQMQSFVASLNASDGAITSNMVIVPTTNGWISSYLTNNSHLRIDVAGYFAP